MRLLTRYSTFYFCRGRVRRRDGSGETTTQMRVYIVDEASGVITLAAVGNDKVNGTGRYFTYTTARPSPFPPEYPTLPAGGATKDQCMRWIRDACLGIRLCTNPPREQHVHVARAGAGACAGGAGGGAARGGIGAVGGGGSGGFKKSSSREVRKMQGSGVGEGARGGKGGGGAGLGKLNGGGRAAASAGGILRGEASRAHRRNGGGHVNGGLHDAAVPTVLCTHPAAAASSEGVLRYVSYSEVQGTLPDGRRTRLFYLVAGKCHHRASSPSGGEGPGRVGSKSSASSAPRLLAVRGEETMKKDKHYRYSTSEDVLRVAMDDAGRPFSSPTGRFKNASVVQEWLEAVVRKSVGASPALVRAAAAARAGAAFQFGGRSVRFAGGDDAGEEDEYGGGGGGGYDVEEEEDDEDDGCEALEESLGPAMFEWCAGAAAPDVVQRLSTMTERINAGLPPSVIAGDGVDGGGGTGAGAGGGGNARGSPSSSGGGDGVGRFKLTDRDAMGMLGELERRWSDRVNMSVLEETRIAHAVASLAVPGAGLGAEVAGTAQRVVVRWRAKMERAVAALEHRMSEMKR